MLLVFFILCQAFGWYFHINNGPKVPNNYVQVKGELIHISLNKSTVIDDVKTSVTNISQRSKTEFWVLSGIYQYTVGDDSYMSTSLSNVLPVSRGVLFPSDSPLKWQEDFMDNNPIGGYVKVYYKQGEPDKSLLFELGSRMPQIISFILSIFSLVLFVIFRLLTRVG